MSDRLSTMTRSVDEPQEARLIDRCRERDARAFEELYLEYRTGVYRIVARMISIEADREEIVQDVFLQIFRSIDSFKGTSKLSTWVHRIALNVVLQHIRRKKSRIKLRLQETLPEPSAPNEGSNGPEQALVATDRKSAVQRALESLTPKKRAALVLHDFEGMAAKEIAQIVGAPTLTVRTRLFYARKEFYSRLEQEPAFSDFGLSEGSKD